MVHIFRYLSTAWSAIQGRPALYPPEAHAHAVEQVTGLLEALEEKAAADHEHDAAVLTSGVLDVARIPVLPSQNQVVSSGGIVSLSAGQQAEIAKGSIVTTTDGRRWVYTGAGGKTSEASYVELEMDVEHEEYSPSVSGTDTFVDSYFNRGTCGNCVMEGTSSMGGSSHCPGVVKWMGAAYHTAFADGVTCEFEGSVSPPSTVSDSKTGGLRLRAVNVSFPGGGINGSSILGLA